MMALLSRSPRRIFGLALAGALVGTLGATADLSRAADQPAAAKPAAAPKPQIAPEADQVLRDMGDYLRGVQQLSFHAEITHDDLLPTGQKLQFASSYDAAIRRPDRVFAEYSGDSGGRRFWYDGKTLTLYEPTANVYATEPARPSIDATLDELVKELGFTPPLSDLMTSDPAATLRKHVLFGFYVGETSVDGVRCHHLAFVEPHIDWQIWIEDGIQWVPRKLVITYKSIPGAPQFTAMLSGWDFATRPPDALFRPQLPADAAKISFLTAAKTKPAQGGAK